jgi:hypothetical protein
MRGWLIRCWPLAAWVACIILLGVAILQVQGIASDETKQACRHWNGQMREVNERAETINTILSVLREDASPARDRQLADLYVSPVLLVDCDDLFDKPWPLSVLLR